MKANKVHRNLAGAMLAASSLGSAQLSDSGRRDRNRHDGRNDDASFRSLENFKMALLFNEVQGQFGKK
ncbi:hypothetical protein [Parapedobacter lycopersici]|uniref:hypothetical protein n=1 Tax=Parapedobacter lycopersici TaxID=1864939 RepID=UPI00214DAA4B|nr:hypothetical protein [Parapedobacter lycopersici]